MYMLKVIDLTKKINEIYQLELGVSIYIYIYSPLIYYIILCGFIRITLFEFTYLEQVRKICIRFSLVSHKKRDTRFGLQDERNTLIIDFLKEAHLCLWQAKIEVEIVTVEPISLCIFVRRRFQKIVLRRLSSRKRA